MVKSPVDKLTKLFEQFGPVTSFSISTDKSTGRPQGSCFSFQQLGAFDDTDDAQSDGHPGKREEHKTQLGLFCEKHPSTNNVKSTKSKKEVVFLFLVSLFITKTQKEGKFEFK